MDGPWIVRAHRAASVIPVRPNGRRAQMARLVSAAMILGRLSGSDLGFVFFVQGVANAASAVPPSPTVSRT